MKKKILTLALMVLTSLSFAQIIYNVAGNGANGYSGDGGFAVSAEIESGWGIFIDASNNKYFSDGCRVRKIDTYGIISTIAGIGYCSFSGDGGQATAAEINYPIGIVGDGSGNIYISDNSNNRVRKINTSGVISTFAGNGTAGYSGDGGQATAAELNGPTGLTIDGNGNIYISDFTNNVIRKINTSGVISTFAGNHTAGYSGDGGQATAAELHSPDGLTYDQSLNILCIADAGNSVIRKVNTSGIISTFAGNHTQGFSGDGGQATAAEFNLLQGIATDGSGTFYIDDALNYRVRKINTSGVISTFAGNGTNGNTGDGGLATAAELSPDRGIAVDGSGNLFVASHVQFPPAHEYIREISTKCPANAGPNVVNYEPCCGGWPASGVVIGSPSVTNMSYSWSPSTALSSTTIAQPTSTWSNTTSPETYTVTVSYSLCTTNTSTVQVSAQAYSGNSCCRLIAPSDSSNNPQLSKNFTVYPNPANSTVTLDICSQSNYFKIMDLEGKVVTQAKNVYEGKYTIDVSKYAKGIYIVELKHGDVIEKQKLIVD